MVSGCAVQEAWIPEAAGYHQQNLGDHQNYSDHSNINIESNLTADSQ